MLKKFLQNTRKPVGLQGRMMLKGMNAGHAPLWKWSLSNLELSCDICLVALKPEQNSGVTI